MLQNKIYQNFIKEIVKTFFVILLGLTLIAWTVRAVNFLDLIVESGYSTSTYFLYSLLNLFGILTKFIPLSFLLALIIFIIKQIQEKEFLILWTSGVKKMQMVNLFFLISIFILFIYLLFSTLISPFALNKSRLIISQNTFNSFLPTVRVQQFSDSFEGFTFIVEKRVNNNIENVFIHDKSNTLKNLTSNQNESTSTTIVSQSGIIKEKKMILFNGQIISSNRIKSKNEIIKFEQLSIDLRNLQTGTIKQPKLQETSTLLLLKCMRSSNKKIDPDAEDAHQQFSLMNQDIGMSCKTNTKKEITTVLNRRIILPFYIPIIALICSFLIIKTRNRKNLLLNKYSIFLLSFLVLLYAELIIRYTGLYKFISFAFIISPIIVMPIIYFFLHYKLSRESLK